MTKKIISALSLCLSLCVLFTGHVFAAVPQNRSISSTSETLENGTTIVTTIEEFTAANTPSARSSSKTGTKTIEVLNSSGDILWTFGVTGTFTYNGSSATCTRASYSYSIKNSNWKFDSASTRRSGNQAIGKVTMNIYVLGLYADSMTQTVTLSCSGSGNLY